MSRKRRLFDTLLTLILTFCLLAVPKGSALANGNDPPRVDPRLLQMAEENPEAVFMVIVQKAAKNKDLKDMELESEVLKGGGQVKKQLDLITSFSAEMTGKEIAKLAKHPKVRWISADAPMVSTAYPGMDNVRDEFTSKTYDGNNGSANWSTNWIEVGDGTGSSGDLIQIVSNSACAGGLGYCLRLDPYTPTGKYIYREANLSGMVSVWLSFHRNNRLGVNMGGNSEQVQLQVSPDGGKSWTTLVTYTGKSNTGEATESYDISSYASAKTQIRFIMPTYQSGIRYIYFDDIEIVYAQPSAFLSTIRADQLGLNGKDLAVAVIDSGLTTRNNDFKSGNVSRIIANASFTDQDDVYFDLYGHGTHVAGIIGGNGAASSGKYRGVATETNLINIRVSNKEGMIYESDVVSAMQWVYENKDVYNIRVVNLSMNSTVEQSYHTSPLDAAVEILWFNSIVVVVSAGNNGTGEGPVTIYPPANDPFVITVGATEDKGTGNLADDNLAVFSAYGTTIDGFAKPDLVAPGRNIVAPLSDKASTVYTEHPLHRVGDNYFRMSGTSMSAPVVSGAVALLLQDEPNLTPDQVKYRLMMTANYDWLNYALLEPQPVEILPVEPQPVDVLSTESQTAETQSVAVAYGNSAGYLDIYAAVYGTTTESANQGITLSQMLSTGSDPITWGSVGWNSVGWNSVGWNSVGWNSVGWNSVGWNSVGWNSGTWDD